MNGDFVGVVNAPNGAAGQGHNALVVGNDKTGWRFISKEGRQEGANATSGNNPLTGGPALKPKEAKFGTLQDLLESPNFKEYKSVAVFTIQSNQTEPLIKTMRKEATSKYVLLTNNCGHACLRAAMTVGLDPGYIKHPVVVPYAVTTTYVNDIHPAPNTMYSQMIKSNPTRLKTIINE